MATPGSARDRSRSLAFQDVGPSDRSPPISANEIRTALHMSVELVQQAKTDMIAFMKDFEVFIEATRHHELIEAEAAQFAARERASILDRLRQRESEAEFFRSSLASALEERAELLARLGLDELS